jgi:hypothetical protein
MLTCINFHVNFMWFIISDWGAAWSKVSDLSRRDLGWRFGLGDDARTTMAYGMLGPRASSRCPLSISFYFLTIVSLLACLCPLWTSLDTVRMHQWQSGRHGEHLEPPTSTVARNRCLFFSLVTIIRFTMFSVFVRIVGFLWIHNNCCFYTCYNTYLFLLNCQPSIGMIK